MTAPEDPPSFVVRTEAQKAAWDNGFRLERGIENGGWLRYGSTSANREIWLAGVEALSTWPGLRTVLAVETIRSLNGTDKVESEIRYFLSSGADDPATLGAAIRMHWSIENALHWCWTSLSVRMTAVCVIAGRAQSRTPA